VTVAGTGKMTLGLKSERMSMREIAGLNAKMAISQFPVATVGYQHLWMNRIMLSYAVI